MRVRNRAHTRSTKMSQPKIIVVDGVIGSGKSTLINLIKPLFEKEGLKTCVVPEPIKVWEDTGRLKQFYDNPERRAYQFQTKAFHDRVKLSREIYNENKNTTDIFILERSIFTDVMFMNVLFEMKTIDKTEYEDYTELWSMWKELVPFEVNLFVYLKPDVSVAMERVKTRSRSGENAVSVTYQTLLQKYHDEVYNSSFRTIGENEVPCITLQTNKNFRDDEKETFKMFTSILTKIV